MQFGLKRRDFITLLGSAAAGLWPLTARAQQGGGMRRIGLLIALAENDAEGQLRIAAFRRGLRDLGWTEGRNIYIDGRWPGGDAERMRVAAAELVTTRPDVIFAGNHTAVLALQKTSNTSPVVFVQVVDPVAAGFVASLARPGGNITGFALYEHAIAAKWIEMLRELAPLTSRIGVIYDPASAGQGHLRELERAMPPTIRLAAYSVRSRAELEDALERFAGEPNSALIVFAGPLTALHRDLIRHVSGQAPPAFDLSLPVLHGGRRAAVLWTGYGRSIPRGGRATSTVSSRERSLPTCPCSFPQNINW